jgi:hypothetical protein
LIHVHEIKTLIPVSEGAGGNKDTILELDVSDFE